MWLMCSVPALAGAGEMEQSARAEIAELHQFFEDWFNGAIEDSDASFARLEKALDSDFELIGPEGRAHSRDSLLVGLRSAHGKWAAAPGRIWIENVRLLRAGDELLLVSYEEWQEVGGETEVRLSSVLFGADPAAPLGLSWLHLHEVWTDR